MAKVRLNYDSWLALPAAVRKKLGLASGQQLELGLVGGAIVLRPLGSAEAAGVDEPAPAQPASPAVPEPEVAEPSQAAAPSPPVKRGRGRPRKSPGAAVALPSQLRPAADARQSRRRARPYGS